jgi:hypothetical protein
MGDLQEAGETGLTGTASQDESVKKELTVSFLAANVYGTLMGLLPALLLFGLFWLAWRGKQIPPPPQGFGLLHGLAVLVAGIVGHELLHGLGWMIFGGVPRSEIHIGVKWKLLTPFAHTPARMSLRGYRWGTFLPGLLLGIVPSLLSVISGSLLLMVFGFFFTITAGGDFLILCLLRNVPGKAQVTDHPSRVGAIIYL